MDMVPAGDRIQGDGHRPGQERAEITYGPLWPVLQEDGHPVAFFHLVGLKPPGHGQAVPVNLTVGELPYHVPFPVNKGRSVGSFPNHPG